MEIREAEVGRFKNLRIYPLYVGRGKDEIKQETVLDQHCNYLDGRSSIIARGKRYRKL